MPSISSIVKYLPLLIGVTLLGVIALLAPWKQVGSLMNNLSAGTFITLLGLSLLYYAAKTVRFWYILRLLDIKQPFLPVSLLYLSGQPFSLLPAGELYRTILLKKYLGVSVSKSAPSVTLQGLVEAIVLIAFSVVGALIIGQNQLIIGIVGALFALLIVALQRGWLSKMNILLDKLPYVTIDRMKYKKFLDSHQKLLAPKNLSILLAFSSLPVLSGVGILYLSSKAIGFDISVTESAIGYSLPVIVSGLSFLPGGLGVSEGGIIGLLQLFGASAAVAITIALLVRIFTLVFGLLYGVIAQIILHTRKKIS